MSGSKTPKRNIIKRKCIGKKQNGEPCNFKVSSRCGGVYCNKHFNQWRIHGRENKFKLCTARTQCYPDDPKKKGYKRILPIDYSFSHCDSCRIHGKNTSSKRRNNTNKINEELTDKKLCKKCKTEIPLDEIIITKHGKPSLHCKKCFERMQKIEANRPKRDRKEYYNAYEKNPERKAQKIILRKENPDKIYDYYNKYREKQLLMDPIGYRKKGALNQAKYRSKHPEKNKASSIRYNTIPNDKFRVYKLYAEEKGYEFNISFEEFKKIIESDCFYCGCKRGLNLNTIDRLDSNLGYIKENMVPSCKTCNFMKNTLNLNTFLLMCVHIATFNKCCRTGLFPKVFNNYSYKPFSYYKINAAYRKKDFNLTKYQISELCDGKCYICGRESNKNHSNGIDRVNNDIGYIFDNCKTCCADCNYLKKDQKLDDFIFMCVLIEHQHKNNIKNISNNWTPSGFRKKNMSKLDKDKIDEIRKERREEKFAKTVATKSKDARKERMKEIRESHDKKKSENNISDIVEI